jgi:hypothetical protein
MFSRTDFIRFDEGVAARFDYEPDNTLTLSSDLIRDSVQADVLAITELKQSRQNKVISFSSDFTALAINPGDVIRITNDYWGWSNKLFRVTQMVEEDRDDGSIVVNITAIEYSDDVYAYNSITRFDRSTSTGIPSAEGNDTTKTEKNNSLGVDVGKGLATEAGQQAVRAPLASAGYPVLAVIEDEISSTEWQNALTTMWPGEGNPPAGSNVTFSKQVSYTGSTPGKLLQVMTRNPYGRGYYKIDQGSSTYVVRQTGYLQLDWFLSWTDGVDSERYDGHLSDDNMNYWIWNVKDPKPGTYTLSWYNTYSWYILNHDSNNLTAVSPPLVLNYQTGQGPTYTTTQYTVNEPAQVQLAFVDQCFAPDPLIGFNSKVTWTFFQN